MLRNSASVRVDQVVIVEQAAPVFLQPVARDDGVGDGEQGAGPVAAQDGAPPLEQGADAGLLAEQPFGQARMGFADRLGDDHAARRDAPCVQWIDSSRSSRSPPGGFAHAAEDAWPVPCRSSGPARARPRHPPIRAWGMSAAEKNSASTSSSVSSGEMPSVSRQFGDRAVERARAVDPAADRVALSDRQRGSTSRNVWSAAAVIAVCKRRARARCRVGGALEHDVEGELFQQLRFGRLVEHLEARGDVGLERKLMQKPRAEGVDGLHFQAARRLDRDARRAGAPARGSRPTGVRPSAAIAGIERRHRRARSIPTRCRTRASPCWRRRPW